jgi:hypothetical protein
VAKTAKREQPTDEAVSEFNSDSEQYAFQIRRFKKTDPGIFAR